MPATEARLGEIQHQMMALRAELRTLLAEHPEPPSYDYTVQTPEGPKHLRELFGSHRDLLLFHNMGRHCDYCTLWADGLNGFARHFPDRCAAVLVSADPLDVLQDTARTHGWSLPIASAEGTSLFRDFGFADSQGSPWPGVTALHLDEGGSIRRTGRAPFGPGDDYCAIWSLFDLLEGGPSRWEPRA